MSAQGHKNFVKVDADQVPRIEENMADSDYFAKIGHGSYEGPGMTVSFNYGDSQDEVVGIEYDIDGGMPSMEGMEYTEKPQDALDDIFEGVPGVSDNKQFQREMAAEANNAYQKVRAAD